MSNTLLSLDPERDSTYFAFLFRRDIQFEKVTVRRATEKRVGVECSTRITTLGKVVLWDKWHNENVAPGGNIVLPFQLSMFFFLGDWE